MQTGLFQAYIALFPLSSSDCKQIIQANYSASSHSVKDVRAQNFPHTDFVKTLTAGRE